MLCKYYRDTTVEDVSEQRVVDESNKTNVKNGAIENVDSLLESELTMDLRESDVQARVVNYFKRCEEIILDYDLKSTFCTAIRTAHKCTILRKHLQPTALHDEVGIQQKLIDNSSTKNDAALYKLAKETALEQDKAFRSLTNRKQQQVQQRKDGPTDTKSNGGQGRERTLSSGKTGSGKRKHWHGNDAKR
ncbi:LOW QUALITY PROTEIN: Hypothetical protein PHPALM_8818 [Phytophthora palmivora]|uniref:Uncharacterized protein n=1 Tax=Phytophthora palmivora TaxID=4796 RepID=A0A2P4Y8W6_9STRA|nr:LOW QUALITY PROTEIN: Hypothetical protein PHPALM_8818 [Phytophthora palmivora]